MTEIKVGTTFKSCSIVSSQQLACAVGSGNLEVLSTPMMIALVENAAMNCIAPFLDEDESSVGTSVNVSHIAATPAGVMIYGIAEVIAVDGKKVKFKVETFDSKEKISEGTHTRFVIQKERFMQKVNSKVNA